MVTDNPQQPPVDDELKQILAEVVAAAWSLGLQGASLETLNDDRASRMTVQKAMQAIRTKYISRTEVEAATNKRYTLQTGLLWDSQDATDGYHQAMSDLRRELGLGGE